MGSSIKEGLGTLNSATLDGLKTKAENEKLNGLTEIVSIPITIIIILVFYFSSLIGFMYQLDEKCFRDTGKRKT